MPGGPQGLVKKTFLDYIIPTEQPWAVNSAVECHPHTVEVTGSNPVPPTSKFKGLRTLTVTLFSFCYHFATTSFKNRIFQPASGLLIGGIHEVGIDVQGDSGAGMPKLGLDVFDVFPVLHPEAGVGMSEIMKPDPG